MEPTVLVAIISAAAAVFCGWMVFRSSGKATDINERAAELAWVKEIRADAAEARRDIDALQDQVRTLTRQLAVVTREAEHWIAEYQFLHRTIWRDGIQIDRLREIVGPLRADPMPEAPANEKRLHREDDIT